MWTGEWHTVYSHASVVLFFVVLRSGLQLFLGHEAAEVLGRGPDAQALVLRGRIHELFQRHPDAGDLLTLGGDAVPVVAVLDPIGVDDGDGQVGLLGEDAGGERHGRTTVQQLHLVFGDRDAGLFPGLLHQEGLGTEVHVEAAGRQLRDLAAGVVLADHRDALLVDQEDAPVDPVHEDPGDGVAGSQDERVEGLPFDMPGLELDESVEVLFLDRCVHVCPFRCQDQRGEMHTSQDHISLWACCQ